MSGSPPAGAARRWAPVRRVALALLLLFDAAVAVLLLGVAISAFFKGGRPEWSTSATCTALLAAVLACGVGAFVRARRGRFGVALGLAAIPAVLAVLAMALVCTP